MEDKLKQMQKNTDLSDIVLEKSSRNTDTTKKWILTAASAILLFLIILIVMKMLKQSEITPSDDNIANIGESVETINKEPIPQEENLFKKEPIIDESSDTDEKFEEMVRKLKEQDAIVESPIEKEANVKEKGDNAKEKEADVKEVKPQELKTIVQEPIQKDKKIPVIVTPNIKNTNVKEIKQPIKKKITKPITKVSKTYKKAKIPTISGYFIQVGATAKSFPDKRFLTKIKNAGFDYIVHGVNIKGKHIKKVLVGPYGSRDAAKNALSSVKANINPSAYIYRLR